jgi:formyltetrahydrofolate deformylase
MLFVSKYNHCLYDILEALIPEINRQNPFDYLHRGPKTHRWSIQHSVFHIPTGTTKQKGEKSKMELLKKHRNNFIVLARYMQVLTRTWFRCTK